ncbi:hypothetical protein CANCADRAFT_30136 [Tortispora caseinolytica NRRL Y-17796]|uniref:HTH APSES-type domain-containing protein n=1 Tax=Tortispora caseinolytica NRRL Y-17796 TaxID=767744 RepID=A0A1E4TJ90_9ASCO|nr:hypothetical protein CANCADRAFT_30136 [Tortispora caseinolytica NRRL Y-17796]
MVLLEPAQTRKEATPKVTSKRNRFVLSPQDDTVNYPVHAFDISQIPSEQASMLGKNHTILTRTYATALDERHCFTVYEYTLNGQSIMWDYHSGYVHLTGIWKAIGNSKADIVRLVENSPDLEPFIRRVRGGFLKIQGTWLPFEYARALAIRTCYHVRYTLIPLFGDSFPDACLEPDRPGFGQLQLRFTGNVRRRRRRKSSSASTSSKPPFSRSDSLPMPDQNRRGTNSSSEDSVDDPLTPPPLPLKLEFVNDDKLAASPNDFLQVLRATRSLQLLSAGRSGRRWSFDNRMGGGFECAGRLWKWDGQEQLRVVGYSEHKEPKGNRSQSEVIRSRPSVFDRSEEMIMFRTLAAAAATATGLEIEPSPGSKYQYDSESAILDEDWTRSRHEMIL